MAIFRFFQNDCCRPPSWICNACVGTTRERRLVVFVTVQNLVGIDTVVLIICTFFDFASLSWKRLFTPKIGGLGFWPPKWGVMWIIPKKGTSLRESASFEPSCVKIRRRVWPVGHVPRSPLWTDMHLIWHSRRGCRRNHLWEIFVVIGWGVSILWGGSKITISHWLSQSPLTQPIRGIVAVTMDKFKRRANGL